MAKVREDTAYPDEALKTGEKDAPVTQYIVTTDNPEFSDKVMGVPFVNGRGLVNAQSIDHRLGRTFDQVVNEFKALPGYHLTPA